MAHRFKYAADYFIQYPVERVTGEEDGWTIHFPHGSISWCSEGVTPASVAGRALVSVDFGDETTTLQFSGGISIPIGKNYVIRHPLVGKLRPERDEEEDNLPPDPSAERDAEGSKETDA